MKRQPVISSNIQSIGYNVETMILEVEFNKNGIYQYYNVPQHVFGSFMNAPSKGRFFIRHIRDVYVFKKIR